MLPAQRVWRESVSLLDVMWPRSNQCDRALLRRNFWLYNNLAYHDDWKQYSPDLFSKEWLVCWVSLPGILISLDFEVRSGGVLHTMPYRDLYRDSPPERGTFFRLQVYERVGILLVEENKGEGNLSFASVKGPKRANRWILWLYKVEKTSRFLIDCYLKDSALTAVKRDAKF